MSEFIFWNLLFAVVWVAWKCLGHICPKDITFVVLSVRDSAVYGPIGTILINDKRHKVHKTSVLWRYQLDGKTLPPEWAEKLDLELSDS